MIPSGAYKRLTDEKKTYFRLAANYLLRSDILSVAIQLERDSLLWGDLEEPPEQLATRILDSRRRIAAIQSLEQLCQAEGINHE